MGFLDKAKDAAEQAASRAKEGVEDVQTKRNLTHTYEELGRTAFDLIEEGQISHDRMTALADEIRNRLIGVFGFKGCHRRHAADAGEERRPPPPERKV